MNQDQSKTDGAAPVSSTPLLVPHLIDRGCTTVQGLFDRCDCILKVHGDGSITNDPRGIMYESKDEYRVLITLASTNETGER